MIEKNNVKAKEYYESAKDAYNNLEYSKSIHLYTKSLSYANYYSQDFVRALAGRLVVLYAVHDYKVRNQISFNPVETEIRPSNLELHSRPNIFTIFHPRCKFREKN